MAFSYQRIFTGAALMLAVVLKSCTTPSIIATQAIRQGDAYNNQNNYDEAIRHYEQYLEVSPQLGVYRNPVMEAEVFRKLGHAYSTQGKYAKAKSYLEKALGIDTVQSNNLVNTAENFRLLGLVNAYSGDMHQALAELNRSLQITSGMENSVRNERRASLAGTHLSLAQVHLTLGNYRETEHHARNALNIYSGLTGELAGISEAELLLGIVSRDKGEFNDAEKHLLRSQSLATGIQLNTGRQLQAISEIHMLKGDIEEAIRFKLGALDEAVRSNIIPQQVIALMRLGDTYSQLGDTRKAQDYYQRALALQGKMDSASSTLQSGIQGANDMEAYHFYSRSGSALGKGLVLLRIGSSLAPTDADSAIVLLKEARANLGQAENREGAAKASLELAKLYIGKLQFGEGLNLLEEADGQTIQPELKWQISFYRGQVSEKTNKLDAARTQYERAIRIIDDMRGQLSVDEFKTLFASTKGQVYDRLIMLLLNNRNHWADLTARDAVARAFHYSEQARSRTFLDMLGNKRIEARNSSDTTELAREQLLKLKMQQLVRELNNAGSNMEAYRRYSEDLHAAQEEYADLIQKIKLNNTAYSTVINVSPPALNEIQALLEPGTAVIEYWISEEALVIFTIHRDAAEATVVDIAKRDLHRYVTAIRNAIALKDFSLAGEAANRLRSVLIEPVSERVTSFENLIIIPHGSLHFLPFQALPLSATQYLIEKHVISYSPSASILYYCLNRKTPSGDAFLGMALGDTKVGNFSPLPGTESEVNHLVKLYPGSRKQTNSDFHEAAFKKGASEYNYVHIATHGVFNKVQPLYSYLLMREHGNEDGQLTVDEIFGLQMKSKLVTLSACETALGDLSEGDELVGLSRAFIYAGSPGVIVSLWKVDDATTAWLMSRFYEYCRTGKTVAQSLTYAQRDLLSKRLEGISSQQSTVPVDSHIVGSVKAKSTAEVRNPYFWAPFIVIGNGAVK